MRPGIVRGRSIDSARTPLIQLPRTRICCPDKPVLFRGMRGPDLLTAPRTIGLQRGAHASKCQSHVLGNRKLPVRHAIWKVAVEPRPLDESSLVKEQLLEDMIVANPKIVSDEWMLIGRQEDTGFGGRIDLLAIAPDGSLVLIELKRNRTPREIMAQALDYATWVERLTPDKIAQIYQRFSNGGSLAEAFRERFGEELDEEALNESHQIVIVAAELDDSTERIINYLNARDIAINAFFFRVFRHGDEQLLS